MGFPRETVESLAKKVREASAHLLTGADAAFIDKLEDALHEAKAARRREAKPDTEVKTG